MHLLLKLSKCKSSNLIIFQKAININRSNELEQIILQLYRRPFTSRESLHTGSHTEELIQQKSNPRAM